MFIRSNVHMHNNRSSSKCSGMYEWYTIAMLPFGLYNLQVTCTQHALMYIIVYNVNAPSVSSFTRLLSVDQFVTI